jgi:nucleoside-diphosphate-sugar epimerase
MIDMPAASECRKGPHPAPKRAAEVPATGILVVTGANGYIGREVVRMARAAGFEVRALVRRPAAAADRALGFFPYALGDEPPETALSGATAVIHLAMDMNGNDTGGENANVAGTLRLREAAHRQGVRRFVFVSSQSAAPSALSAYGRAKWRVERSLDGAEDIVVRPGMVYGGVLCRLVSRLPVIPVVRGSAPLYPIHVEDLARALVGLGTAPVPAERLLCLGASEPIPLVEFLERLGKARLGRKPLLIPVPTAPLSALMTWLSVLTPKAAFLRERVLGILALPTMDTAAGLRTAGISLRPLDLRRAKDISGRRPLLREGVALMRYVFGAQASIFAARRWLRLLPADAEPLRLPDMLTTRPGLLRLVEPLPLLTCGARAREFTKRLQIALLVGEVSGRSSAVLTHPPHAGWPAALLDMGIACGWEAVSMGPRLLMHLGWWRR